MKDVENKFDLIFWGDWALFTNPLTTLSGSKYSYAVPPMSAIKGMLKAIYWKPSIEWVVESVEIVNKVQRETKNVLLQADKYQAQQRGTNTYLKDVVYRVKAHLIPSSYTEQFGADQQNGLKKHASIAHSRFSHGCGYAVPVLGVTECPAFVCETWQRPDLCEEAYYINKELFLDTMLLDIVYPPKRGGILYRIFWTPKVENGVISFPDIPSIIKEQPSGYIVERLSSGEYTATFPEWTEAEGPVTSNV